ncbi:zinc finger protein 423 isoform X2 [Folsomia candida]|uniref:zinc finger protein 423 isoform X2 n=1 Tax=Folsomia candida TaxID=158441 RepID=UPI001604B741|nr:zinc finger protein 423 isoform X2 [Folsomia candida]
MRTLRSGKPLPDPPPVMRGSRGEVTPSAAKASSVAKAPAVVAAAVEEEKVAIPTTASPPVVEDSTTEEESPGSFDNLFIEKVPQPETPTTTLNSEVSTSDIKDAPVTEAVVMSEPPPVIVKRGRGRPPKYPKVSTTPSSSSTPLIPAKAKVGPTRKSEPASLTLARKRLQLEKEELKAVKTSDNKEQGDLPKSENDPAVATPPLKSDDESHPSKKIKIDDEIAGPSGTATTLQEKEIAATPKVPSITITTATPTPELRRSLRCPKKKPAVIVQATMAVERDAQPFLEACTICGEEFNKKMLLQRHMKTHKAPDPPKKIAAATTPKVAPRPKQPEVIDNLDHVNYENDDDDDEEEGFEDYEEGERSFDMKPPIIDFTRKRPSQSSILMKDPVTCNVCGMTFTRRAHLNRHMLLHTGIKPFTCDICNLKFTRKDHMFAHKVKHEKEHKIQCAQCGGGFATWQILQDHIKNVHSSFKPATPGRPKTVVHNTNPDNACDVCGKTFLQRRYLRAHRKLHIRKEARILAQLRMVEQQHFNDDEDSNQDMDNDDGEFDDTGDMEIDESILNPEVQIDDRSSSPAKIQPGTHSPSSLGRQEQDGSPASAASSKQSSTATRKSLSSMNRVIQLAEESSGGSGSEAGSHDSSVVSVENANLDKDELDDFIDYDYKAMMQLKSGNFEDFGDDDDEDDEDFPNTSMECSVCGTTFTERAELRKHYRIHKKKFICRFCGLKLASAGSLMRHNLIHTGKKEFSCKLCSRRFSRKDTLMVHLQAHEKSSTRINMPKPYLCKVCHAGYTMKYNLIRHIKMCHGSMTATNRAAILKQIKQKYKNGIPSSSNKVDRNSFEGLSDDERQFFENGDVKIKNEPMDGEEGYFEEDLNPFDEEIEQDFQEDESHSQRHDDSSNQQNGEAGGENGGGRGGGLCNHCGKVFKNAKSLNTHKWYHSRDKQFICHICNRGFKYSTDLGRHINTHGNDSEKCSTAPAATAVSKPIPNTNSGQSSSTSSQIKIVTNTVPGPRFIRHQLGRPINSIDTRPFGCKICPQRFNHRSNLSRHVRLIHKANNPRTRGPTINLQNYLPKVQPIKLSNGQIVQVRKAETHPGSIRGPMAQPQVQMQQKQPPQYTNIASGGGSSSSYMSSSWNGNVGMPKQLGGSPDSRRSSAGSTVLTPDSFTYDPTSDRPYICNTCGKSFESKNNLWTHCRIHNKIFGCEFCGLKMATRGDLILHLRTHTGKSGLNKHMEKYHGPEGKQLRTYKMDQSQGSSMENMQMNNSGMEISTITAMAHRSIQSGVGMLKSVMHKSGTGLTITKIGGADTNVAHRYSCRLCNTILIGKVQYIRHMNAHSKTKENADKLLESRVEVSTENPSSFTCKECGQVYESQELLTKHILTHSESDAPRCILCGKSCTSLGFLKRHYQYVHPGHPNPVDKILLSNTSPSSLTQQSDENVTTTINGDNNTKPTVVRKVIRGENGEEESDEEFPNESDDPPNLIKPQEKGKESPVKPSSLQVIDVDNLDVDEIVYAANNHHIYKKTISPSSNSTIVKHATNTHLLKTFVCPVAECQRDFQVKADLLKHMRRHVQEQRHQCRICTARFPHKQDAHRHMKSVHNFTCKSRNFPCDFCDLHYATEPDLSNHLQSVHKVTMEEVFDETVDDYDSHEVEEMKTSGNNEVDYELMLKHRENEEEDALAAAAEAYAEVDEDEIPDPTSFLEQSMGVSATTTPVTKNEQNDDYFCELCNKVFETRQKWLYHRYYHIREEKYFCSHCDEKFKLRSHLERHIRTYHNEEKPVYNILTCDQCPRKFTREYDLTTHIQKVHLQIPPAAIQKQRLSAASAGSSPMVRVNRNSNPNSILRSQIPAQSSSSLSSPKPSTSQASLSSMLRGFPKGVTIVRKSWPAMTTPQNKGIVMTKVTSASAKPVPPMQSTMRLGPNGWYSCNLCNKKFKEKKSIDAHRYYHNREEKHLCTHCGARFKQKSDLHRHVRIHHNSMNPKNTIHCPHCYRSFTDIRYMRMHIRRYHGDEAQGSSGRMQGPTANATKSFQRHGINQRGNVRMELEDDNDQEMIYGDEDEQEEGLDWNEDEQQFLDEDDEDQRQMRTMEQLEYLQYQNEAQSSEESSSEGGGGLQLTISCESCGVEVEAADIAEHVCSSEDDLQEEQMFQDEEKDLEEDTVEIKKLVEQEPNTQTLDESPTITLKNKEDEGNEIQDEEIAHENVKPADITPFEEIAHKNIKPADTTPFEEIEQASKVTIGLKFDELVADPQPEDVTTTDQQSEDVVEPNPKDNGDEIGEENQELQNILLAGSGTQDEKEQPTIDSTTNDPQSAPSADASQSEESSGTDVPTLPEL